MSRLIYADELSKVKFHPLPYTHIVPNGENAESYEHGWNDAIDAIISDAPTVDAVPVVHGHWIKIGSQDSIRNMKCSICCEEVFGDVDTEKYCFNCGAKMDEVTE